jgi:NAD+ kinase
MRQTELSMTKLVGILAKTQSKEALATARKSFRVIMDSGLTPVPEADLSRTAKLAGGKPLNRMKVDLLITLGGDGTVLKAIQELPNPQTPILAVNLGRRGYLTEIEPEDLEKSFTRWLKRDFQMEAQWCVSVSQNNRLIGNCLNEALLLPTVPDKMLNFDVSQSGRRIIKARADGFMVATPTGSTAHSFSAGGPVLETSLDVFALTLIAPLQPVKSIVVPADRRITVSLEEPGPTATLVMDGNPVKEIRRGQPLEMKKSSVSARFVRFGDTFLQRGLRRLASERENV